MNGSSADSLPTTTTAQIKKFRLAKSLTAIIVAYISLLILLMAWSYLEGSPYESPSPIRLLTMGLCMANVGLLASSTAIFSIHWPKRMAGLLIGMATIIAVLVTLFDWPNFYLWQLLVELLVEVIFLLVALLGAQQLGYRLLRHEPELSDHAITNSSTQQLSLRDLFMLITSFALVFAAIRPLQPTEQNWFSLALIACGLLCAIISLIAIYSALSNAPIALRGLALFVPGPMAALGYWVTAQFHPRAALQRQLVCLRRHRTNALHAAAALFRPLPRVSLETLPSPSPIACLTKKCPSKIQR